MSDKPGKPDRPDRPDRHERLIELTGSGSKNFLGTGMTLEEFVQLFSAEKIAASWALQTHEERKRRRQVVINLSIELGRIQERTDFSTHLCELAIESVIEGDWSMVEEWAEHFAFDGENEALRADYLPVFATFREMPLQAVRTTKEPMT